MRYAAHTDHTQSATDSIIGIIFRIQSYFKTRILTDSFRIPDDPKIKIPNRRSSKQSIFVKINTTLKKKKPKIPSFRVYRHLTRRTSTSPSGTFLETRSLPRWFVNTRVTTIPANWGHMPGVNWRWPPICADSALSYQDQQCQVHSWHVCALRIRAISNVIAFRIETLA